MLFIETLQTLNTILSSDLLINSRYDIVTNFNLLNTYAEADTAGLIQLAYDDDVSIGYGSGALTPNKLLNNSLLFAIKQDFDLLTSGIPYAYDTMQADTSGCVTNVQYIHDSLIDYNTTLNTSLNTEYLRRDATTTPNADNTYNLGSSGAKWANVYATNFNGTATNALYADVAEIYSCKEDEVEVGQLISICDDEDVDVESELTKSDCDIKCIGVVSEKPALLMNSGGEGVPVALVGKVPVKIVGTVKKGDVIVSSDIIGVGRSTNDPSEYIFGFAKALESKNSTEVELVNCIIKR